jgi:hypothetical protein
LHQPGEFAALDVMSGHVQIALDGMICTGLAPTFVDAQGGFIPCRNRLSKNGASSSSATPLPSSVLNRFKDSITVEKRSTISSDFAFSLDDVFQNRELKPYFKLHFDEIIPSEARDRDVTSALKARGFMCTDVTDKYKPDHQTDHFTVIQATRKVGLDEMKIVVAISGERSITQREKKGEGISVMTNMDSGELIIQVLGVIPRNDQSLIKEMNSVHRTLHNTFKYVRSQR